MASYDSDSSDEDNDYTTTNVILGYATDNSSGDEISHIGGHPIWLDKTKTPSASLAKCKVCNGYMSLLLQLNADLQQYFPHDQRRLQVWTCRKKTCTRKIGSIRALREVKKGSNSKTVKLKEKEVTAPAPQPVIDLGNALFGGNGLSANSNANPFSTGTTSSTVPFNPFSGSPAASSLAAKPPQLPEMNVQPLQESFAAKLNIEAGQATSVPAAEPWPATEEFPDPYPFFFLDAAPEELDPTPQATTGSIGESSKTKYDTEDTSSSALDKDTFESSLDKTFQKFSDIVAQNSEQVLRYEFKGQPLLYSGSDGVASRFVVPHGKVGAVKGIPRCEKCGSQRVFEMQLTPNLIFEVEKDEAMDIDSGMEWGAIIVATCVNNCGEEGEIAFLEEWVGIQWEERVSRK